MPGMQDQRPGHRSTTRAIGVGARVLGRFATTVCSAAADAAAPNGRHRSGEHTS